MQDNRYPNLYIIGAPKCGTTTLADWLREHDDVFVPDSKEPHHFNVDHNFLVYENENDYLRLYNRHNEKYLCDASVWYLYSKVAIPNIIKKSIDSRFVVCLRNPMEMAVSLYLEQKYATNEHMDDFFGAWESSDERREGKNVSKWCREPLHLDYQSTCLLGKQVSKLLEIVDKENIHFVFIHDLKKDPKLVYEKLLIFLGLESDERLEFSASNKAKSVKYKWFKRFVRILGNIRKHIPIRTRFGALNYFNKLNVTTLKSKPKITAEQKSKMVEFYKNDIKLLSLLTGKDLSHWIGDNND
jgi:hypothetical protein